MNAGRRLAIDYGDVRIGLAMSDKSGIVASPLETITNSQDRKEIFQRISSIITAQEISVVYVGLPLQLSGQEGTSAAKAKFFAQEMSTHVPVGTHIRLIDERLSTSSAEKIARESGQKLSRSEIDQFAAVAILESALNAEKARGDFAGIALE